MNLDRMLERCRGDQWHIDELDWSVEPRPMDREEEIAVVSTPITRAAIALTMAPDFG